jgi:rod shape-determining protein MreC
MHKPAFTVFIILFLLASAFIFFGKTGPVLYFQHSLSWALKPFESAISPVKNTLAFWRSAFLNIKSVKESNVELSAENLELYGKIAKLAQLEEENALLRERQNLSGRSIHTAIAAVIGRDFQTNRTLVINKGANDGIRNGMAVIFKGETAVGMVVDAGFNTAKVQTILDTQSRIAAITADTRVSGLARGLGSDIIFDLIAKNKKPEAGELIISSGTDGVWPRGLVIGKVKEIESSDNQVFNTAAVGIIIDIGSINDVFVIIN